MASMFLVVLFVVLAVYVFSPFVERKEGDSDG